MNRAFGDRMNAVELKGLGKRFGRHWALSHVSFCVERGTTCLLTGANGAGKTTLLKVLATAIRPSAGEFRLFGMNTLDHLSALRRRLVLLTHHTHLYYDLSATENLTIVNGLVGNPAAALSQALDRVGLASVGTKAVRHFSAGMKRRLSLARLLITQPELILLDEPFGQLDEAGITLVEELIGEFRKRGQTIFVTTHNVDRGLRLADLHLEMREGQPVSLPQPVSRTI